MDDAGINDRASSNVAGSRVKAGKPIVYLDNVGIIDTKYLAQFIWDIADGNII